MPANHPVNADARERSVRCMVRPARAGYWRRYTCSRSG